MLVSSSARARSSFQRTRVGSSCVTEKTCDTERTPYPSDMVAERRFDGAVRVDASATDLINRWQAEASSELCRTSYRDEGMSKTTDEKEDLEADIANHTVEKYTEHGADSVYKSHSGSIVETSEDLKAKAESQMAEARRTEVTASRNFQMRQQFLEDELKFNAQDLEATEHSLDEAQGQLTTDTADLKMTEDALAEDTAAIEDTTRDCQAKAVEFETATNGRSEELDAYAKARAVISQKTGDGLTSDQIRGCPEDQRTCEERAFARVGAVCISCCFRDAR